MACSATESSAACSIYNNKKTHTYIHAYIHTYLKLTRSYTNESCHHFSAHSQFKLSEFLVCVFQHNSSPINAHNFRTFTALNCTKLYCSSTRMPGRNDVAFLQCLCQSDNETSILSDTWELIEHN
jgi:hypothetical protein